MFYLNETLNAETALANGLITKIIAGDFDEELMSYCAKVSCFSSQVSAPSPMFERLVANTS